MYELYSSFPCPDFLYWELLFLFLLSPVKALSILLILFKHHSFVSLMFYVVLPVTIQDFVLPRKRSLAPGSRTIVDVLRLGILATASQEPYASDGTFLSIQ